MTTPLDLDAIRERAREAARSHILWEGNTVIGTNEVADAASGVWQAEVERLRAALVMLEQDANQLAHEVMAHQTTSDYERGHEHGALAGMKARNVLPRSALVQVGWVLPNVGRPSWLHPDDARWGHDHAAAGCLAVYVIREATDE